MDHLPYEIIMHIVKYLSLDSVLKLSMINKRYRILYHDDYFWGRLALTRFKFPYPHFKGGAHKYFSIRRVLNKSGSNVDSKTKRLKIAIEKDDVNVAEILIYYVDPTFNDHYAIRTAVAHRNLKMVNVLLSHPKVDPNAAMARAILTGDEVIVKRLSDDHRIDVSRLSGDYLVAAATNGKAEIVKIFMDDKRVDPSVNNNASIRYACLNNHYEVVKLLMSDPRVDIDDRKAGYSARIHAILKNHTSLIRLFEEVSSITKSG